jgi:hypothetical protein
MGGWWDDFSNNLATGLSPFVTLFGEAPTKQYLSECLSLVVRHFCDCAVGCYHCRRIRNPC